MLATYLQFHAFSKRFLVFLFVVDLLLDPLQLLPNIVFKHINKRPEIKESYYPNYLHHCCSYSLEALRCHLMQTLLPGQALGAVHQ